MRRFAFALLVVVIALTAAAADACASGYANAVLADNPQLSSFVVHDLNHQPRLPFDAASFDAVVCAVSVQYLIRPVEVFTDVRRVLRAGGHVVVSFSNRCFPTKAVAIWLANDGGGHRRIVRTYLERSGFAEVRDQSVATSDDPLSVVSARGPARDDARRVPVSTG